jgi:60S ribosome subunit biogenesis protein NIP7
VIGACSGADANSGADGERESMRPLTEEELKIFFEKLSKYIGNGIKALVDRPDGRYCFRLHRDRVYYIGEHLVKHANALPRDQLVALGCTFGKFTKTKKFRLHVTCLDYVAQHAQYRVWLKSSAEQSFLYGNHVLKAGLGRITEDTPQYQGVVILNMADVPLGFGTAARSTAEVRKLDPQGVVAFQADVGEYLRDEGELT